MSGRFCPSSGAPAIECAGDCGSVLCPTTKIPDSIIGDELGKGEREGGCCEYQPSALPSSFKSVTSFDMMAYVRDRLTRITPETCLSVATKYLKDASFAFFMERARNGIRKCDSKDLIPHYETILNGKINEDVLSQLREIIYNLKEIIPDKGKEERIAQRFKVVFALYKASGISLSFKKDK